MLDCSEQSATLVLVWEKMKFSLLRAKLHRNQVSRFNTAEYFRLLSNLLFKQWNDIRM